MAINNIVGMTDEQKLRMEFSKGLKGNNSSDLDDDQQYAVVLLKLHDTVTPSDYATLQTNIEAITGILPGTELLFHNRTKQTADLPADHTQRLDLIANINLRDDTPE